MKKQVLPEALYQQLSEEILELFDNKKNKPFPQDVLFKFAQHLVDNDIVDHTSLEGNTNPIEVCREIIHCAVHDIVYGYCNEEDPGDE